MPLHSAVRHDTYTLDMGSEITADRPAEKVKWKETWKKKVQLRKTFQNASDTMGEGDRE